MISELIAPSPRRSFSISADWLELLALIRGSNTATIADLTHTHDLLDDNALGSENETGIENDPDIVDEQLEKSLNAVAEELGHRQASLGDLYPFKVEFDERRFIVTALPDVDDMNKIGRDIYRSCLLISCIRSRLFDPGRVGVIGDPHVGRVFQIAATLAAAGYVSGDAYWFGAPRPDKMPLLDALAGLASAIGVGQARREPPEGETRYAQDAGVDVVAWRDHSDRLPAKIILYGQCASGMNWEGKPVAGKVTRLQRYFSEQLSNFWTPALFTPFPLYMDKEQAHGLWTSSAQRGFYCSLEREMGVIIDRIRVVHWSVRCLESPGPSVRPALDELDSLSEWAGGVIAALQADKR